MPRPIKERIANLRKEIAQISEENREHLRGGKSHPAQRITNADFKGCRKS
jgi:hypothetical protein